MWNTFAELHQAFWKKNQWSSKYCHAIVAAQLLLLCHQCQHVSWFANWALDKQAKVALQLAISCCG